MMIYDSTQYKEVFEIKIVYRQVKKQQGLHLNLVVLMKSPEPDVNNARLHEQVKYFPKEFC